MRGALIDRMEPGRTIIAVAPAEALRARRRLFAALEAAFPVAFVEHGPDAPAARGIVVIASGPRLPAADEVARHGLPSLVIGGDADVSAAREPVDLLPVADVDRRVRGVTVADRMATAPFEDEAAGRDVLAVAGALAVWTRVRGALPAHRVRSALPELGEDDVLYAMLSQRPLSVIALVHFLRELMRPGGWRPAPLRAAIVFDDPNLRRSSYGFIDYERLLAHADTHGYHAAMAMIPLDAGRAHRATASLFARRPDRLSLVLHGNDHVREELMGPSDDRAALRLAAQALRRVAAFECRHGLHVDRIMMPPHGLCSRPVTAALGALGFDALCAIHPLPWTERPPTGPPLAGWLPAQFVAGCPVIPRIPLTSSAADIALRAFLDHPLVLYGHHEDVARGLEPLADAARLVNRVGHVRWMSVGDIAATNHAVRAAGGDVAVRPFARRNRVVIPRGVTTLSIEAPVDAIDPGVLVGWSPGGGEIRPLGEPAPVAPGPVELRLHARDEVDAASVEAPAWRPWPRLRRAVTEVRDRTLPLRATRLPV